MTVTQKVLGQSKPGATTLTDAYTVPALTQATISSIVVTNQSSVATSFRISIAIFCSARFTVLEATGTEMSRVSAMFDMVAPFILMRKASSWRLVSTFSATARTSGGSVE